MTAVETGIAKAVVKPDAGEVSDPAYLKIRNVIYQGSGIYYPDEKLYLLASRCARRMRVLKANRPAEYLEHLTVREKRDEELRLLLNEITIGETYMFRSPAQLEALRNVILPQMLEAKSARGFKRLRLWSAGCSTGAKLAAVIASRPSSGTPSGSTTRPSSSAPTSVRATSPVP